MDRRLVKLLPFSTHRIQLSEELWTMPAGQGEECSHPDLRMKALIDRAGGSLKGMRVLDLGCLEGGQSVYLAKQGATEVVGVELRDIYYQRCLLVKDFLKLSNLTSHKADAREVRRERLGEFDIIFAGGILYHLEDPHTLLKSLSGMLRNFILIDTHVALRGHWAHRCSAQISNLAFGGEKYEGRWADEYPRFTDPEAPDWSSWGNPKSFWLFEDDLVHMLTRLGFRNVSKVYNEPGYNRCNAGCPEGCRIILVAGRNWKAS